MNKVNPYNELLMTMRQEGSSYNPPSIQLGTIKTVEPDVSVEVNGLILTKENLYVSYNLLNDYTREGVLTQKTQYTITGTLSSVTQSVGGGSGEASFSSHSHPINAASTLTTTSDTVLNIEVVYQTCLQIGDLVTLYKVGSGQYVVMNKVVKL